MQRYNRPSLGLSTLNSTSSVQTKLDRVMRTSTMATTMTVASDNS